MSQLIGSHVEADDPLAGAAARRADFVQILLSNPQTWKAPVVTYPGGADQLKTDAAAAGLGIYVHAPYVINVASTNNRIRIPSRKLLQQVVNAATSIGAKGVIVHGGSVSEGDDLAIGFDNWRKAVDGLSANCPILIENTAGGTNSLTRYLKNVTRLWDAISSASGGDQVGFCLDTCHAHAAGESFDGLIERVLAASGRIDLVHCNDSRDAFGSGADRHANLGHGQCDPQELLEVVTKSGAPLLVETPGGVLGQGADIEWLRARI